VGTPRGISTIGDVVLLLVLAHGTAGLAGDGIPSGALYVAVAVGAAIGAVGLRARGPVPIGGPAVAPLTADGSEVGPWPGDDLPASVRIAGQVVGVLLLALVLAVGWLGSDQVGANPLTVLLGSVLWWLVPALAWLLGDWWRVVDPFDALAAGVARLRGRAAVDTDPGADEASDWWVPAALLATFAWLVTCTVDGLRPRSLVLWVTALTVVMVVGAIAGGRRWVRRSSPYAVLCGTVAAASPVGWDHGRIRLRSPFQGLAVRAGGRRSLAVLVVVLGATLWEAVAGTQWWFDLAGTGSTTETTLWSTVGLIWVILLVAAAWTLVARAAELMTTRSGGAGVQEPLATDLAPSLGPLVVTAILIHQVGSLLIDGQNLYLLAANPFALDSQLYDTSGFRRDETLLSPSVQAWIQIGLLALALGVVLVAGWDRLVDRVGPAVSRAGWSLAAWTAGSGAVALSLLLGA